jgi:acetyltransferase-like isoleucine patch superfamily enzyme
VSKQHLNARVQQLRQKAAALCNNAEFAAQNYSPVGRRTRSRETQGVKIEQDAFIGPGAIILPNVTIGRGAVVTAGSIVSQSVPPMTVVQGNPAVPTANCGIPLSEHVTLKDFSRRLRPLPK